MRKIYILFCFFLAFTQPVLSESFEYSDFQNSAGYYELVKKTQNKNINMENKKAKTAQEFLNSDMPDNAKKELSGIDTQEAKILKLKIKQEKAPIIEPKYSFMIQNLSQEFRLDAQKFGLNFSCGAPHNSKIYGEYNIFLYTSGDAKKLHNVVNNVILGVKGRPSKKFAYNINLGAKMFQHEHQDMLNTNSYLKWYFENDTSIKFGFYRENMEQSYLSSVGKYVDGVFTGRCADNNVYLEIYRPILKNKLYVKARGSFGAVYGHNLPTNMYYDGELTIGKKIYDNPNNPWINKINIELKTDNFRYQYNLLDIYDKSGQLYGGYFSPQYFDGTTFHVKLEGKIKKWNLKYGVKAFGGVQTYVSNTGTIPAWGVMPYIKYEANDHITLNAEYRHFSYADVMRDFFIFNMTFYIFRHKKG